MPATTRQHVIVVDLDIDPARFETFLGLMLENARGSRAEPGGRRFDVVVPKDGSSRVALFEIYDDEAAFAAHQQSAHYRAFVKKRGDMILSSRYAAYGYLEADAG